MQRLPGTSAASAKRKLGWKLLADHVIVQSGAFNSINNTSKGESGRVELDEQAGYVTRHRWERRSFTCSICGTQAPVRSHVPVPHRNLVLASLGAAYAAQLEVGAVMLALNKEDLGAYSATSPQFLTATQAMFQVCHMCLPHPPRSLCARGMMWDPV